MDISEKDIKQLGAARGAVRGTTLITYIVAGLTDVSLVKKHFTSEIATAVNIQSKQTRSNVIKSLKSLSGSFESFCRKGVTPANGLVMIAGAISDSIPSYI
jgi:peptide subunit release factor 1 (eRF1)